MDIHVEARWMDGDMQGGDTLACACLLDLPPCSPKKEEWNSDVSSPGFMRVRKSKSDKSGQVGTWQRCVSGVVFI